MRSPIERQIAAKGAALKILDPAIDTSTPIGRMLFGMLAAVAQFEREIMSERQRKGIAKAHAEGKYRGRQRRALSRTRSRRWRWKVTARRKSIDAGRAQDRPAQRRAAIGGDQAGAEDCCSVTPVKKFLVSFEAFPGHQLSLSTCIGAARPLRSAREFGWSSKSAERYIDVRQADAEFVTYDECRLRALYLLAARSCHR